MDPFIDLLLLFALLSVLYAVLGLLAGLMESCDFVRRWMNRYAG